MKKFLVFVLLVGLAAIPVYRSFTASEFAISQANPLGEYHVLDSWLMERGFEKSEGVLDDDDPELAGARKLVYNDVKKSREDNVAYRVTLVLDSEDKVRAVGGVFYSGSDKVDMPMSRTESISQGIWKDAGGAGAPFIEQMRGKGRFAQQFLVASFDKNGVHGVWQKRYLSNMEKKSIFDDVKLYTD